MKPFGKSVAVTVAILCVVLFSVSIFGISTVYGDVTTNIMNGVHLVPRGFGFERSVTLFFQHAEESSFDADRVKSVFERRLDLSSVADYAVYPEAASGGMIVELPYDSTMASYFSMLEFILSSDVLFEVREGAETDDNDAPAGITANVIAGNSAVKSAKPMAYASVTGTSYYLDVTLTSDGEALIRQRAEALMDADPEARISFWIDGEMISYFSAADVLTMNSFRVASVTGYSLEDVGYLSILLSTERLDETFALRSAGIPTGTDGGFAGENNYTLMLLAFAAVLSAAGAALIIRYRVFGVCALLSILGAFGCVTFVLTGFSGNFAGKQITLPLFGLYLLLLVIYAVFAASDAESIRRRMNGNLLRAVHEGLSRNVLSLLAVSAVLFLSGLFMTDLFHRDGGLFQTAVRWIDPSFEIGGSFLLGQMGLLLLSASVFGVIFVVFANRLMIRSVISFNRFKNAAAFGGSDHESV